MDNHLDSLTNMLRNFSDYDSLINRLIRELDKIKKKDRRVILCGNGGSSSIASHFTQDLQKTLEINALCLTDNISMVTALANDYNYDYIFSKQLLLLAKPDDLLIAFSGSGNSRNIIFALKTAKDIGMKTVAIIGTSGGYILSNRSFLNIDILIYFDGDMQISEDMFSILSHYLIKRMINGVDNNMKPKRYCSVCGNELKETEISICDNCKASIINTPGMSPMDM